jgi:hypothetical protein
MEQVKQRELVEYTFTTDRDRVRITHVPPFMAPLWPHGEPMPRNQRPRGFKAKKKRKAKIAAASRRRNRR